MAGLCPGRRPAREDMPGGEGVGGEEEGRVMGVSESTEEDESFSSSGGDWNKTAPGIAGVVSWERRRFLPSEEREEARPESKSPPLEEADPRRFLVASMVWRRDATREAVESEPETRDSCAETRESCRETRESCESCRDATCDAEDPVAEFLKEGVLPAIDTGGASREGD